MTTVGKRDQVIHAICLLAEQKGRNWPSRVEFPAQLSKGGWQTVRVEFEFLYSNFLRHGHDLAKCAMSSYVGSMIGLTAL